MKQSVPMTSRAAEERIHELEEEVRLLKERVKLQTRVMAFSATARRERQAVVDVQWANENARLRAEVSQLRATVDRARALLIRWRHEASPGLESMHADPRLLGCIEDLCVALGADAVNGSCARAVYVDEGGALRCSAHGGFADNCEGCERGGEPR
jgi:hypothetical protein